jgi:N-formylglutamate amidohydrolase
MNNIVIHIPHSGKRIPKEYKDNFYQFSIIPLKILSHHMALIGDTDTDKFVDYKKISRGISFIEGKVNDNVWIFKALFDRMFLDMERYEIDELEEMAALGMGAVYIKSFDGTDLRAFDAKYREEIIAKYYRPYHKALQNLIIKNEPVIILDLHSFKEEVSSYLERCNKPFPDICIGYDENTCSLKLLNICVEYFQRLNYSVEINYPYSGAYYPNSKSNFIQSIMIEINTRVYLTKSLNHSKNFLKLKNEINNLLLLLQGI